MKSKPCRSSCGPGAFIGSTVLGERGQVVIPKELRDELKLQTGAKLLVFHHPKGSLVLIPIEHMRTFMQEMNTHFNAIQDALT